MVDRGPNRLPARAGLSFPAWVVLRIDVVELQRGLPVNLHDGFSASHGEVVHVGIEKGKAPGSERLHFVGFELIAHSKLERSGDDGDVFPVWMPMGRNAEPIRHLQANCKVTAGRGWVTLEYGELRARANDRRRRTPRDGLRGKRVFFVRMIVRGAGEKQTRPSEQSSHCNCKEHVTFHD